MKTATLILAMITLLKVSLFGQDITQQYNNDPVKLIAIGDYATNNNWDEVFSEPTDPSFAKEIGNQKNIAVAPDGSVFMSHKTRHEIWKFDKNGNLEKKFGQKGYKPGEFPMIPFIEGVFDNKYIYTSDVHGRLQFFDFEGNFIKSIQLDYMPLDTKPLSQNKIAILGHVPWKDRKSKKVIAIKDFNTEEENIIWSKFKDNSKGRIIIEMGSGGTMGFSVPYSNPSLRIASSKKGNLIVANPADGIISIYSPEGVKKNSFPLNIDALKIDQDDIDEYYKTGKKRVAKFKERLISSGKYSDAEIKDIVIQYETQLEKLKDQDNYPDHLPYFTNIMVDSDGNILVFEFTEKSETNKFRVYSYNSNGEFLNRSSFLSDKFNLNLSPSSFIFYNDYIFNVAEKKTGDGCLMRLVKFKIGE